MFDPIGDIIGWVEDQIDWVNRRINSVYSWVDGAIDSAVGWVEGIAESALSIAERAWDEVRELKNNVGQMVNDAIDAVIGGFYWVLEAGATFFQITLPELWNAINQTIQNIEDLGAWVIEWVTETIEQAIEEVTRVIEEVSDKLTTVWKTLFEPNTFWKWFEQMIVTIW